MPKLDATNVAITENISPVIQNIPLTFILITLWHVLNEKGFLMSGIALAMFVLIDFLPERRFNGTNLIHQVLQFLALKA